MDCLSRRIVLGRLGGAIKRSLNACRAATKFDATSFAPGTEVFNSNQFQQGFPPGRNLT